MKKNYADRHLQIQEFAGGWMDVVPGESPLPGEKKLLDQNHSTLPQANERIVPSFRLPFLQVASCEFRPLLLGSVSAE
jgi:hypothetical protein